MFGHDGRVIWEPIGFVSNTNRSLKGMIQRLFGYDTYLLYSNGQRILTKADYARTQVNEY